MASLLGQYPSLHKVGKTANHFSTNIISLIFCHRWESSQSGGGHSPFRLVGPLNGQLLRGSCGTPRNEF